MQYRTTKRVKLLISIIVLFISFFIIVFFVHDPFFNRFIKSKAEDIPDFYEKKLLKIIANYPEMSEELRGELWNFNTIEGSKQSEIYKINKTINVTQYIIDLSDYVKISYIIVGFFIMCISVTITKWYLSDNSNLFISDRKISIEDLLKENKKK